MTSEAEETARLRRAFAATTPSDAPRPDCPPSSRLWEGVHGELPSAELRLLLAHLAECPVCTEAWRLAEELGEAGGRRRSRRWLWVGAAAAAVVVLAVGIAQVRWQGPPTSPGERAAQERVIASLVKGALPRGDCLLRWTGPRGARYDVVVTTGELEVVSRAAGLEKPAFRVPAADLAQVAPGARLLFRVTAELPSDGLAVSETFSFQLRDDHGDG